VRIQRKTRRKKNGKYARNNDFQSLVKTLREEKIFQFESGGAAARSRTYDLTEVVDPRDVTVH